MHGAWAKSKGQKGKGQRMWGAQGSGLRAQAKGPLILVFIVPEKYRTDLICNTLIFFKSLIFNDLGIWHNFFSVVSLKSILLKHVYDKHRQS